MKTTIDTGLLFQIKHELLMSKGGYYPSYYTYLFLQRLAWCRDESRSIGVKTYESCFKMN